MSKRPVTGATIVALGCSYAMALPACSSADDLVATSTVRAGLSDRMTRSEWTTYMTDSQYVRSLAPPDVPVRLNYADPRQYNFVMSRLKLAGKSAANSPYLFELIAARRQSQLARGLQVGALAEIRDEPVAGAAPMHYIEQESVVIDPAQGGAPVIRGAASSTVPGGTDYTYMDTSVSTIAGFPIAPLEYDEKFGEGQNVTVPTTGSTSGSSTTRYTLETYQFIDLGNGDFKDSFDHHEFGSVQPQSASLPLLTIPVVDAPRDVVGHDGGAPDGIISACMDRAWTHDCDFILHTGSDRDHRVWMPLKGSVSLATGHIFDARKIQTLQAILNRGETHPDQGLVKLVLTDTGGGCDVDATGALHASMAGFWSHVSLSGDGKTFSWNLTGANAARFAEGCTQNQDHAKLTMRIPLPVLAPSTGVTFTSSFTISNDPKTLRPDKPLPPLMLTNSCLAEGTQIQLADGKLAPIESLHIGQATFNPFAADGHALTIQDTAKGIERNPMVQIRDEAGRALMMTEMHPIATPDRGMVQARVLRAGDVVLTTQGPSKLVEVSRAPYSGQVYNLKVGSEREMASLGHDQTIVYANGFMVGDGKVQQKYETLAIKPTAPASVDEVPERWRLDYVQAQQRRAAATR